MVTCSPAEPSVGEKELTLTPQSGRVPTKTSHTTTTVRKAELMDNSAAPFLADGTLSANACVMDQSGHSLHTKVSRQKQWRKMPNPESE